MKVQLLDHEVLNVASSTSKEIRENVWTVKAPYVWDAGHEGRGVVVAILDTGCDYNHPDIQRNIVGGYNFTGQGTVNDYGDKHGHGTHVAGIVSAVAPMAKLLILKVLDDNGAGDSYNVTKAINHAISWRGPAGEKVDVITMSLGGPQYDLMLHSAIKRALVNDIVVVAAAGNGGDGKADTNEVSYPAYLQEVVCVGAYAGMGNVSYFSNSNDQIDLVAPGSAITSTYPGGRYATISGTSMAAPHVAGGLALIINQFTFDYRRRATEPELFGQLIKRTSDLEVDPRLQGAGLLFLTNGMSNEEIDPNMLRLEDVMKGFAEVGASQTPEYWLNNARPGKTCRGDYVELFIKKMYITLVLKKRVK